VLRQGPLRLAAPSGSWTTRSPVLRFLPVPPEP